MAIQAPNTNMLANPYVPNVGSSINNALRGGLMANRMKMQENEFDNYEGDRAALEKTRKLKEGLMIFKTARATGNQKGAEDVYAKFAPGEEAPKFSFSEKEDTIQIGPITIKGTPEQLNVATDFLLKHDSGK